MAVRGDEAAARSGVRAGGMLGRGTEHGVRLLLSVAALVAVWGLVSAWSRVDVVNAHRNPIAAAALLLGTASVPLVVVAWRRLGRRAPPARILLAVAFGSAVWSWLAYALAAGPYYRGRVGCLAAAWAALVAIASIWLPAIAPHRSRALARVLAGSALGLLAGEVLLRSAAWLLPSPLLVRHSASSALRLRTYAFPARALHIGFPTNELGFYDDAFAAPGPARRPTVAVLGDSFSGSVVPHAFHYTTVAERELGDVDVWNVGWPALGPADYRALLATTVRPLQPDAVIVSLFLGNDLDETSPWTASDRWIADWFDRGNVLLWQVPRRLWQVARGLEHEAGAAARLGDLAGVERWLHDPEQEPGTFRAEDYLRLEVDRALVACDIDEPRIGALLEELRLLRALAPARRFGVVLIPDEYMVEDILWQQVQRAAGRTLARHALADRLAAWCRDEGVPCLDLLPVLTAVKPLPDGDRHLYLLRDTHWNARGNDAAGRALAPFVRQLLADRTK
ncbi:MAG TPA: hypothetical protein VF384_04130 [Planctomycetota bacterium]